MAEIPRNHIMLEAGEPGLNIHPAYTLLQTALLFSFIRNRTTGQTVLGLGVFQVRRQWGGLGAGHYLWAFSVQLLPGPRNTGAKQKAAAARQDARLTWGCIMPPACNPVLVDMHENTSFHPMLYFPNYSRALALQRCGCFHLLPPPFYIGFLSSLFKSRRIFLQLLLCLISCFLLALLGPSLVPHPSPKTFNCKSELLKSLRKRERLLERGVTPFPSSLSFSMLPEESLTQTLLFFLRQSGHESLFTAEVQVSNRIVKWPVKKKDPLMLMTGYSI